jgi:hypothetical protein
MTWRTATFVIWGTLAVMLAVAQGAATSSRGRLPTIKALIRLVTAGSQRRVAVVLVWMWLGWHAFAR